MLATSARNAPDLGRPVARKAMRLAVLLGGIVVASLVVNTLTIVADGTVRQRSSSPANITNDIDKVQLLPH